MREENAMADATPKVTKRRGIPRIWLVPIIALLLGIWMVYWTWSNKGPEITIMLATAEGIEAGKTKIKTRSVEVGLVESVGLGEDLQNVVVTARLEPDAEDLLREDTQFWVVRVRVGMGGVSGLGTLLSGGYIQLEPGEGAPGRREFEGLPNVPVTPVGTPGLKFSLLSDELGSVSTGDPILYKGFTVGRVESTDFDVETQQVHHRAFIDAPYDELVTSATRFWSDSGLSFSANADGIELHTGSLESMLIGGVAFGLPDDIEPGELVEDGVDFALHPDRDSINDHPFARSLEYVVEFNQSVRGLRPGAPIEYRGLPAGRVVRLMIDEIGATGGQGKGTAIPVLLQFEPGRLRFGDSDEGVEKLERSIELGIKNGLRATLATGSLLTGRLLVALDIYPDAEAAELGSYAGRPTIPTIASGLDSIEQKVAKLLDKLNELRLEDVTGSADATLRELTATIAELRALVASQNVQSLPGSIDASLDELARTLKSVRALADSLEDQPSALIFPSDPKPDPEPRATNP
jgi:paraquat-inducible protein B